MKNKVGSPIYTPHAFLSFSNGKNNKTYYIKLNTMAMKTLKNPTMVSVMKTVDGNYIVLQPEDGDEIMPGMSLVKKQGNAGFIYCSGAISSKFLKKEWFDRRKCKIKKDKHGRIYICLNERIGDDDRTGETESKGN